MEMPEPDLTKCPNCGGVADNGHDRCIPPKPYYCTRCEEIEALRRENEELKAKLDKANDALKFYGAGGSDYWDAGKRARTTLEEIG